MQRIHDPVLLEESTELLIQKAEGVYFDGTLGFGGHTERFLKELSGTAVLIGTDVDPAAFGHCKDKFQTDGRVHLYNFNFDKIEVIAKIESLDGYDGVFADLGVSSFQLDNPEEGFSYRYNAPLDLRMDKNIKVNAAEVLNTMSEDELADIFYKYGEEKNSRKIAAAVVRKRKSGGIKTTGELTGIIEELTPERFRKKTLSRVFQALRIFVNDEMTVLEKFLEKTVDSMKKGGRIVVISYHSLEDRIVKERFKYEELDCICPKDFPVCRCEKKKRLNIITRKPVVPGDEEIKRNKRARSAKLRAAERV